MPELRFLTNNFTTNTSDTHAPVYNQEVAKDISIVWYFAFFWAAGTGIGLELMGIAEFFFKRTQKSYLRRNLNLPFEFGERVAYATGWVGGNVGVAFATYAVSNLILSNTNQEDLAIQKALIAFVAMPTLGLGAFAGSYSAYHLYRRINRGPINFNSEFNIVPIARPASPTI